MKLPDSPYKGPAAFSEEDEPFFFGRERESRIISANLRTRRLTLLYGPTGVGKSSVLQAGVVYNLRHISDQLPLDIALPAETVGRRGLNLPTDLHPPDMQGSIIVVVFSTWVEDSLSALKDEILAVLKKSLPKVFSTEEHSRLRALELCEILEQVTAHREVLELLIILDQFEQYFVPHRTHERGDRFGDQFSRAVSAPHLRVNFLISIREDWLARLDRFKGSIPYLFENSLRIHHLERETAGEAITKPIDKYNEIVRKHAGEPGFAKQEVIIEDEFTPEALNQLQALGEAGDIADTRPPMAGTKGGAGRRIQASSLQIVMEHLWKQVQKTSPPTFSFELLRKSDTAQRIIQSNVQQSLAHLSHKEKLMAARFFRLLITPKGTKLAFTAEDLAVDQEPETIRRIGVLLDKLSESNFRILNKISPRPDESKDLLYELTSDVLADPVLDWVRDIRNREHRWQVRIRYAIALGVIVLIIIFGGAFLRARQQRKAAQTQQRIVEEERAKAQRALDAMQRLDNQTPFSKAVLRGHGARVTSAVFTPSGRVLTASADGSAILWDVETRKPIREFKGDEKGLILAKVNPGGDRVVTAAVDGTVILWDLQSEYRRELRGKVGNHITDISFSPTGDLIAVANIVGAVIIWNTATGEIVKEIPGNDRPIRQVAFSPSGRLLAAASDDHTVHIWRVENWNQVTILAGHTGVINSIAFSPNEQYIASAGADATVQVWDMSTGKVWRLLRGHAGSINSVDFSDDGKSLLTASDDTTARVWNIDTSKSTQLIGHTDKVLTASFSPGSQRVVTAGRDGVVRIWSAASGQSLVEMRGHIDQVTYVTYSKDGHYVLTAGEDATARVWFANQSGRFRIDETRIEAKPDYYLGDCPATISFVVKIKALNGNGTVVYRFKGSDDRIWPQRELVFEEPGEKYINWYWRINKNYAGFESIEIIEPKGIREQKAHFRVVCMPQRQPSPGPTPPPTPP